MLLPQALARGYCPIEEGVITQILALIERLRLSIRLEGIVPPILTRQLPSAPHRLSKCGHVAPDREAIVKVVGTLLLGDVALRLASPLTQHLAQIVHRNS